MLNPRFTPLNDDITLFALVDLDSSYTHHLYEYSQHNMLWCRQSPDVRLQMIFDTFQ